MRLYDGTNARRIPDEMLIRGMGRRGQAPIEKCNASCRDCSYNLHIEAILVMLLHQRAHGQDCIEKEPCEKQRRSAR